VFRAFVLGGIEDTPLCGTRHFVHNRRLVWSRSRRGVQCSLEILRQTGNVPNGYGQNFVRKREFPDLLCERSLLHKTVEFLTVEGELWCRRKDVGVFLYYVFLPSVTSLVQSQISNVCGQRQRAIAS
jgi:hypothetical protein